MSSTQIPKRPHVMGVTILAALLLTAATARANDMSTGKGAPVYDDGARTIYYQHGVRVTNTQRQPDVRVIGRPVNTPHPNVRPGVAWPYYTGPMADHHSAEVGFQGWTYYVTPAPVYELWQGR